MIHNKDKVNAIGAMIRFSHLLCDTKFKSALSVMKPARTQTPTVTTFGLLKTENISAFSSTNKDAITKITAEKRLAMRKRGGSLPIYFPPHAACPGGNPSANNI